MILRHIFSNINIPNLLHKIKKFFNEEHFLNIEETIQKFLACLLKNVLSFINVLFAAPRINSRSLVNPDFVLHAEKNTLLFGLRKTAGSLIDVKHRAVLFTIPKELREFFFYDRNLLTKLTYAVNDIFKYQFHNIKSKKERVHKIGKYSKKYFTNSDIIHY